MVRMRNSQPGMGLVYRALIFSPKTRSLVSALPPSCDPCPTCAPVQTHLTSFPCPRATRRPRPRLPALLLVCQTALEKRQAAPLLRTEEEAIIPRTEEGAIMVKTRKRTGHLSQGLPPLNQQSRQTQTARRTQAASHRAAAATRHRLLHPQEPRQLSQAQAHRQTQARVRLQRVAQKSQQARHLPHQHLPAHLRLLARTRLGAMEHRHLLVKAYDLFGLFNFTGVLVNMLHCFDKSCPIMDRATTVAGAALLMSTLTTPGFPIGIVCTIDLASRMATVRNALHHVSTACCCGKGGFRVLLGGCLGLYMTVVTYLAL
jgi:hypothetical protein